MNRRTLQWMALALGAVLGFPLPGATQPRAPAGAASGTFLRVDSNPSDAGLWVNGAFRGNTPISLTDLPPGEQLLTLRKADHREANETVRLEPQQRRSVDVRLAPITGLVLVHSHPPGAEIRIDGAFHGRTPALLTDLPIGRYRVNLSLTGHRDDSVELRIADRTPQQIHLDLISDSATLRIRTQPVPAEVRVNGVPRGVTPLQVTRIPEGETRLELSAEGYQTITQVLRLSAGEYQELAFRLEPKPAELRVETTPPEALVILNDQNRGRSPLTLEALPPGPYRIRVELADHDPATRDIQLAHGESQILTFTLTPNTGRIVLTTEPSAVSVYVSGRPSGVTAVAPEGADTISEPLAIEPVPVGRHELRLTRRGYFERTIDIQVERGQTLTLHEALPRRFVPDYEVITDRRVFRGVLDSITSEFIRLETAPGVMTPIPTREIRTHRPLREDERIPVPEAPEAEPPPPTG